jgi:hypothetical protein
LVYEILQSLCILNAVMDLGVGGRDLSVALHPERSDGSGFWRGRDPSVANACSLRMQVSVS